MSTEHKNLAEALAAFQAEVPTLPKDATNPHFRSRFTPLDTMVETVRPLLAKHGLAWSALPCFGPSGEPALRYQLRHAASDEVVSDVMPLLVTKNDPQGMGSALTYARRYSLASVLNLVADEDDDGNRASRRQADVPELGRPWDAKLLAKIVGAACTKLAGDSARGRALFEVIRQDCGGYFPQGAALAVMHCAETENLVPHVDAPDPS